MLGISAVGRDKPYGEMGGDSLSAALMVTLLREHDRTEWITVSDIYEARTIRELALLGHVPEHVVGRWHPIRAD